MADWMYRVGLLIMAMMVMIPAAVCQTIYVGISAAQREQLFTTSPPFTRRFDNCATTGHMGINVPMIANIPHDASAPYAYILNQFVATEVGDGSINWQYNVFTNNSPNQPLRTIRSGHFVPPRLGGNPAHLTVIFNQDEINASWPSADTRVHIPIIQHQYMCSCGFLGFYRCPKFTFAIDHDNIFVTQYATSGTTVNELLAGIAELQAWDCPSSVSAGTCSTVY